VTTAKKRARRSWLLPNASASRMTIFGAFNRAGNVRGQPAVIVVLRAGDADSV
jgi:hypothetical protein